MDETHEQLKRFWDADAATYDDTPSHAVSDPVEAAAWRAALSRLLPAPPARVLDAGAGTGAITLLAAELGYETTALDLSSGMLERLRAKAEQLGAEVRIVAAPADHPPPGPFEAVISRHVLWTLPDPVAALRAWRDVGARLVCFEGEWGGSGPAKRLRSMGASAARRALRIKHDHHDTYGPDLIEALPFSRGTDPAALVEMCAEAGWRRVRIERLYDIEWARRRQRHTALRPFEGVPQFAISADA